MPKPASSGIAAPRPWPASWSGVVKPWTRGRPGVLPEIRRSWPPGATATEAASAGVEGSVSWSTPSSMASGPVKSLSSPVREAVPGPVLRMPPGPVQAARRRRAPCSGFPARWPTRSSRSLASTLPARTSNSTKPLPLPSTWTSASWPPPSKVRVLPVFRSRMRLRQRLLVSSKRIAPTVTGARRFTLRSALSGARIRARLPGPFG